MLHPLWTKFSTKYQYASVPVASCGSKGDLSGGAVSTVQPGGHFPLSTLPSAQSTLCTAHTAQSAFTGQNAAVQTRVEVATLHCSEPTLAALPTTCSAQSAACGDFSGKPPYSKTDYFLSIENDLCLIPQIWLGRVVAIVQCARWKVGIAVKQPPVVQQGLERVKQAERNFPSVSLSMKFILIHFTIIIIIIIIIARPRPAQVDHRIETVQTGKLPELGTKIRPDQVKLSSLNLGRQIHLSFLDNELEESQ